MGAVSMQADQDERRHNGRKEMNRQNERWAQLENSGRPKLYIFKSGRPLIAMTQPRIFDRQRFLAIHAAELAKARTERTIDGRPLSAMMPPPQRRVFDRQRFLAKAREADRGVSA
jgi:hypothetical protein